MAPPPPNQAAAAPTAAAPKENPFMKLPMAGKLGILAGLVVLLSLVYYFTLHLEITTEISDAERAFKQAQTNLAAARERQRQYLALTQELTEREAIDRVNRRVLPENTQIATFLQDLNRLAELSGLRMQLVEPRPEEPLEFYVRIPVSLKITGRYHQLAKFFYNVSRLERAINMENIEVSEPHAEGDEVLLTVEVMATTFRRLNAEEAGSAGAAPAAPAGGH